MNTYVAYAGFGFFFLSFLISFAKNIKKIFFYEKMLMRMHFLFELIKLLLRKS